MALRNQNPFAEISSHLCTKKNPYLEYFRKSPNESDLPIRYGPFLKNLQGKWRGLFPNPSAPLYLEIGCHLGKTLCEMASENRDSNFIGIDITFKRVATTAQRAVQKKLANIQTALVNAKFLSDVFDAGEIDGIFLFFPDPWTKSRKAKHRLVNEEFLNQVKSCLKRDGFFWLKTDHAPYFEDATAMLRAVGFTEVTDPCDILTKNYETTFERKFRLQGLPSYSSQWLLPQASVAGGMGGR